MDSGTPISGAGRAYKTRLQRILVEEGRRQTWLAARIGLHASRLNLIVNGLPIDDDDLKTKIADALGRTTTDVFDTPIDSPVGDLRDAA